MKNYIMDELPKHWFSYALITLWLIVYLFCQKIDLVSRFANKGSAVIGQEYYRYLSALFLHNQLLHVLANSAALYFVGKYLEAQIIPAKLLVFSLMIGVITEIIFSAVFKESVGIGGSPIVYALIGLIAALQIMKVDMFQFKLGNLQCNWIAVYAVFANIPLFSDSFVSTLMIHGLPFGFGMLFGCIGIALKLL